MKRKPTKIEQILAANLRRERKERGWPRKELARRAGNIQEAIVVKTESLISFPTVKNLELLAKALGIEPYQLLMPEKDLKLIRAIKGLASNK